MHKASILTTILFGSLATAADPPTVWDGVYSKAQADRGKSVYAQECARCHSENLGGGEDSPELAGSSFVERWEGKTVADLYELTQKSMPTDSPGSLSRKQYADVIAYLLSANDFPAGQTEVASEAASLRQVRIGKKR